MGVGQGVGQGVGWGVGQGGGGQGWNEGQRVGQGGQVRVRHVVPGGCSLAQLSASLSAVLLSVCRSRWAACFG